MSGNVIRHDVVKISWDVERAPFDGMLAQMDKLRGGVSRLRGTRPGGEPAPAALKPATAEWAAPSLPLQQTARLYDALTAKHQRWQRDGYVLSYIGRNIFPQAQIKSFSCRYTHRIAGGCEFSLTLQEVRVASTIFSVGLGYSGNRRIGFVNGDTTTSIINLSPKQNRFHTLMAGETLYFIANQFRGRGVTVQSLQMLNRARAVFLPGYQGDFERLKPNAKLLLGVW